jgi:hypothetical protein
MKNKKISIVMLLICHFGGVFAMNSEPGLPTISENLRSRVDLSMSLGQGEISDKTAYLDIVNKNAGGLDIHISVSSQIRIPIEFTDEQYNGIMEHIVTNHFFTLKCIDGDWAEKTFVVTSVWETDEAIPGIAKHRDCSRGLSYESSDQQKKHHIQIPDQRKVGTLGLGSALTSALIEEGCNRSLDTSFSPVPYRMTPSRLVRNRFAKLICAVGVLYFLYRMERLPESFLVFFDGSLPVRFVR